MNVERIAELAVASELFSATQMSEKTQRWLAREQAGDGAGFVQSLVNAHELTEFQARALLAGIPGPYQFGPYQVTSRLTAGRLGDIYHATQGEFGQRVSLKIFPTILGRSAERMLRLGREARVSLQVDHLHVVKTFQVGKVDRVPFIALEELDGETLEQRLRRDSRLPYIEACHLAYQAALGLAYLHGEGIVHRDICPAYLWVTPSGLLKIMEFGAARDAMSFLDKLEGDDGELTVAVDNAQTGDTAEPKVLGHYEYMAPEQAQDAHTATASSDLYSLGCTLFHMLTGEPPFSGKQAMRQMLRHATEVPRSLVECSVNAPEAVQQILSKLLAKQPSDRFASADELSLAIADIVPPRTLPELEPVNTDFLKWLESQQPAGDTGLNEFKSNSAYFLNYLADR